jgi:hypothetical protein
MNIETLLLAIAILLLFIFWKLSDVNARLKDRFPSEKELDSKWAKQDPRKYIKTINVDRDSFELVEISEAPNLTLLDAASRALRSCDLHAIANLQKNAMGLWSSSRVGICAL